jgi:energy-coupling factor transporter ATP-binding protein EcfA2
MDELKEQSNPFSTGGGGINFETRIQASFIIALIAGTPVPCMPASARVKSLSFQSKYKTVNTDDIHVVAEDDLHQSYKLYIQIKHEVTVTESAETTFSEVISAAWQDFKNPTFNERYDSVALVTGPLAKVDVANTIPFLEWARYSADAEEFALKSSTVGFASEKKRERLKKFRTQLDRANNDTALSDDEFWRFLRAFHLVSYDLDQAGSVTAALLGSLIKYHSDLPPSAVLAKIVTVAQEFNQNAGTLTPNNLPVDLTSLFKRGVSESLDKDISKLRERSNYIFCGISSSINGIHVSQHAAVEEIRNAYKEGGFLFVTGERGAGKSGLVKEFVKTIGSDTAVFYMRAEDFDRSHLNDVFAGFGLQSDLSQLVVQFSLLKQKILIIESAEKILELNNASAFSDLLNYIGGQEGWGIIATGRDYAYQQLAFNYLHSHGISFNSLAVKGFTPEQVGRVCESVPSLKLLVKNSSSAALLSNPFFIDLAVRALKNGAKFDAGETQLEFRTTIWNAVIENQRDRRAGMPSRRRSAFIEIAKQRAKKMVFGVRELDFDAEVVAQLESDNLITRDPRTSLISPAHDVLEDWALEEFIESEYLESLGRTTEFLAAIGSEPAINRGFRLWLGQKMASGSELQDFIESILEGEDVASYWKDEVIASILQSDQVEKYLQLLKHNLLNKNASLLLRFYFMLRLTCQMPIEGIKGVAAKGEGSEATYFLWLKPFGNGWQALINFTYANRSTLGESAGKHIIEVLSVWAEAISIWSKLPPESSIVGELCLHLLEPLADSYKKEAVRNKLLKVLLKVSPSIPEKFQALMERDVFVSKRRNERPRYADELVSLALTSELVTTLSQNNPDLVIRLSMHEWMRVEPDEVDEIFRSRPKGRETYGLEDPRGYFPASGIRGPFRSLFQYHPRKGLDFVLNLCRTCASNHVGSEDCQPHQPTEGLLDEMIVETHSLNTQDGVEVLHYASPHLWKGYRGHSTVPYLLQCALMAFENWLVDYVEIPPAKNELDWIYDYVLKSSNSVLTTAVLASVAIGFPEKVGASAYPLLRCPGFYTLDLMRGVQEQGGREINWFGTQRDAMSRLFEQERSVAALRTWRRDTLETLLFKLQLLEAHQSEAYKIVDELKVIAESTKNTSLQFMIHRVNARALRVVEVREDNRIVVQTKDELSEDLQQIQRDHQEKHDSDSSINRLYVWSKSVYEDPASKSMALIEVEQAIEEAKRILKLIVENDVDKFYSMALGAVATTAAVVVRDHIDKISADDIDWCVELMSEIIMLHADEIDGYMAVDITDAHGAGACGYVIAKLLICELKSEQVELVKLSIVMAITHSNVHVCSSAAKGIRDYLWGVDPILANYCIGGAVEFARFEVETSHIRRNSYYGGHSDSEEWGDLVSLFRNDVLNGKYCLSLGEISRQSHSLWRFHIPLLMVPFNSVGDMCGELFTKIVNMVYEDEALDQRSDRSERIHYDVKKVIQDCVSEHVIAGRGNGFSSVLSLLLEGCSKDPSFIYIIKLRYDGAMEKAGNYPGIWELWHLLAPKLHEIALVDKDAPYVGHQNDLNTLLSGMLYGSGVGERHPDRVKAIEVGAQYLKDFFKQSTGNSLVYESLCTLIYDFHDLFFDEGIFVLAKEYKKNQKILEMRGNTVFCLEMSLARFLRGPNRTLGRKLYEACLDLLTGVVETGSARAYYLRESLIRTYRIAI